MLIRDRIERKLTEGLAPQHLAVIDESHRHAGHAGAQPGGETHFHVDIVATAFEDAAPIPPCTGSRFSISIRTRPVAPNSNITRSATR